MLRTLVCRRAVSACLPVRSLGRRGLLTQSYSIGPNTPPLLEQTVPEHFASIVSEHGDKPAVISRHQQTRLTYGQLDLESNAVARGLQKLGVKKGDRVAVSLGNNIEFATLTYALFKLGAILVPLNPAFNSLQVVSALTHLSATTLIIGTETNLPRRPPRSNEPLLRHILPNLEGRELSSELVPSLTNVIVVDNSSSRLQPSQWLSTTPYPTIHESINPSQDHSLPSQGLSNNDIVNIQFTSGTTSMPKAACLTHRSILNNGHQIGSRMLLTPRDIVCCPPPLFHCFGCILGYMATATHGASIVFPSEAFDPHATLVAVAEERATALYGVPTMFVAEFELLSQYPERYPLEGFKYLRTGIAAGSSIPAELMRKLHRIFNLTELTICYGMTETSPVSAMTTTDDPLDKRIDSVGRLLPHVHAKIVSPSDRSKILPIGERGELVVSGYLVMKGYWGDADRTAEVLVPGTDQQGGERMWMHTGDEASMDEEGYVKITGRIKDLIIRGGENIHPLEVENCLFAHPKVREVSVVGLPDERYGECVAAFVVRANASEANASGKGKEGDKEAKGGLTAEEVRTWVRGKLSHHLVPKYVFWVDTYPKTASGKIQKFKLREMGIQLVAEGKGVE